ALFLCAACGKKAGPYIDGFNPPPVADGFQRFVTPPIRDIAPGTDDMWCQWIAPPADADHDVVIVEGLQSKFGHHVVLYATSVIQPVGTSRRCSDMNVLEIDYLGAIGGEGGATFQLPDGVVFRVKKGEAL